MFYEGKSHHWRIYLEELARALIRDAIKTRSSCVPVTLTDQPPSKFETFKYQIYFVWHLCFKWRSSQTSSLLIVPKKCGVENFRQMQRLCTRVLAYNMLLLIIKSYFVLPNWLTIKFHYYDVIFIIVKFNSESVM